MGLIVRGENMKIIAFYLPQFHNIPENDQWWGDGFTEWVNVKKAKPLFEGHKQPRVPLGKNYYNLLNDDVKIWQAKIAKEHGIYGFCYYHYWFNGKLLLERPVEQMLNNKDIDMPFCLCWANEPWTKAWVNQKEVLIPQFYGGKKEWKEHFEYLYPFFIDDRYIKVDGKPFVVIYRAEVIPNLNEMLDYWNSLAQEMGLPGLSFAYQELTFDLTKNRDDSRFDYDIEYQPGYALFDLSTKSKLKQSKIWKMLRSYKRTIYNLFEKKNGFDLYRYFAHSKSKSTLEMINYDKVWEQVLKRDPTSDKNLPGAFVNWDNTPRKQERGRVFVGASPSKFEEYLKKQIIRARDIYHKDMLFMFAWNEWAEGGYLEPDEEYGFAYLNAVKNALEETDEFPW